MDLRPELSINYFPSVGEYSSVLEQAGFEISVATLFDRLTPLEGGTTGLRNWMRMFRPGVYALVPGNLAMKFQDILEQLCRDELLIDGIWHADYRRLRVRAVARHRGRPGPQRPAGLPLPRQGR